MSVDEYSESVWYRLLELPSPFLQSETDTHISWSKVCVLMWTEIKQPCSLIYSACILVLMLKKYRLCSILCEPHPLYITIHKNTHRAGDHILQWWPAGVRISPPCYLFECDAVTSVEWKSLSSTTRVSDCWGSGLCTVGLNISKNLVIWYLPQY